MDIFNLPAEVVDAYVLPHLDWNDLLRFRKVCKWTKAITEGYLKVHPELAPEIEIDEEEKSFGAFLKMGIPTSRIFLNNTSEDQFYEDAGEDVAKFLDQFGRFVRFLRVDQISILMTGKELEFLDGLKNLESLEADRYGGYPRGLDDPEKANQNVMMKWKEAGDNRKKMLPVKLLSHLRTLKIGNNEELRFEDLFIFVDSLLVNCTVLESVAIPFSFDATSVPEVTIKVLPHLKEELCNPMAFAFFVLTTHIKWRRQQDPNAAIFKKIDFVNFHQKTRVEQFLQELQSSIFFLNLCDYCIENEVKLENVGAIWFVGRISFQDGNRSASADLGIAVRSLVNMDPEVFSLNLPNLQRIEIKSTSQSSAGPDWRNNRPNWSSLRSLDITVDSKLGKYFDWNERLLRARSVPTSTLDLFDFFFEDVSRTAMSELRLEFSGGVGTAVIPNTEHIVAACPNLKKLKLVNWPGTNKSLTKLWSGLPGLEEVLLENCEGLGNVAFVGDVKSPVFLKLQKLKKLYLKGLDAMPKITDTLFSLVIRHLPLTHLILTSNSPVKSITGAGVRFLCDGKFAGSVQKFPFKDWSLGGLSAEEFQKLEELFQSSKML